MSKIPAKGPSAPPPAVARAMAEGRPTVSSDKLDHLKKLVREMREIEQRIENGNDLLATLSTDRNEYRAKKIPELMEALQIPALTVESGGNEPPYQAVLRPHYSANIKSATAKDGWKEERRQEAFDYLREIGHDDLIKTYVTFAFPKGVTMSEIGAFCRAVSKIEVGKGKNKLRVPTAEVERGVHHGTLTSWLKDQVENHKFVPDLEKIGGFVGKVVDIKVQGDK